MTTDTAKRIYELRTALQRAGNLYVRAMKPRYASNDPSYSAWYVGHLDENMLTQEKLQSMFNQWWVTHPDERAEVEVMDNFADFLEKDIEGYIVLSSADITDTDRGDVVIDVKDLARPYNGDAKIGDAAWYRPTPSQAWQRDWQVTAVGKAEPGGVPGSAVEITKVQLEPGYAEPGVPPKTRTVGLSMKHLVLIPPAASLPVSAQRVLRYPNLRVVRDYQNDNLEHFTIYCVRCDKLVTSKLTEISRGQLRFTTGRSVFDEVDFGREDAGTELCCGCPRQNYAIAFCASESDDIYTEEDLTEKQGRRTPPAEHYPST